MYLRTHCACDQHVVRDTQLSLFNLSLCLSLLPCRDYSVLSNFTLAYFEDSGWYKVNYSSLEGLNQLDLLWGKGEHYYSWWAI